MGYLLKEVIMNKSRINDVFFNKKDIGHAEEDALFSTEIEVEKDFLGLEEHDLYNKIISINVLIEEGLVTGGAVLRDKNKIIILTKYASESVFEEIFSKNGKLIDAKMYDAKDSLNKKEAA